MITRWAAEGDPGPCPVDDAPHTTCTSPDYVPSLSESILNARAHPTVTVPVRAPRLPAPPVLPPLPLGRVGPPPLPEKPFTTRTYRRKKV